MKPLFNNKWVLTSALLATLGFNISFNKHEAGIATADFASTLAEGVVEGNLQTAKGLIPVRYIGDGDNKVIAIIPKGMKTEGDVFKVCETCGYESISLKVETTTTLENLNVALLAAIEKTRDTVVTEKASAEEANVAISELPEDADHFASLEKCDDKSSESAVLDCRTSGFLKIVKNKRIKVSEEAALEYYKDSIEPLLAKQITESRRALNAQRRASVMPNQWFNFESNLDAEDPNFLRQEILQTIETLISDLPTGQKKVRDRVQVTQTLILKAEALELQQTMNNSKNTSDPAMSVYLMQEGNLRKYDLESLMNGMLTTTHSGLQMADITASQKNQYMGYMNNYVSQMYQGMNTNIYGFIDGSGAVSTLPVMTLDGRVQSGGRISTLPVTQGASADQIFQQQGQMFTGQTSSVVVLPQSTIGATSISPTGQVLIPLGIPTQNIGIQFGVESPISQESIQLRQLQRQAIRGN